MNHPPELNLQFQMGQGATGLAFRDGTYQLTRRQRSLKGKWDRKYQMTSELEKQVHRDLKWIISFPLLMPDTTEAIGILNIDGLVDIPDDETLGNAASAVDKKVRIVARTLSLQPSTCIAGDQLG